MRKGTGRARSPEAPKEAPAEEPKKAPSPWLLLPTFSNNPKLGTSVGAMAGYVTKFDPQSQVSIFGVSAQYTSTDSATVALFARTSFAGDQHRLNVGAIGGLIKNDYDDFLGSGQPLKSEDHIRSSSAALPVPRAGRLVRRRAGLGHQLPDRRADRAGRRPSWTFSD